MAFLIVEDDMAVADALSALLAGSGQEVRVFASAEALIETGLALSEHTVVVDLGLPGMSGADLVEWLNSQPVPPRVFVISGKPSRMIEHETRNLASVRILRKPPQADWFEAIAG